MQSIFEFGKSTYKFFVLAFLFFLFSQCSSTYDFFQKGEVTLKKKVEILPIDYSNQLPIVEVRINGKKYHFLIDTGAPTVISPKIYNELNLKPESKKTLHDSQGGKKKQILTLLPEMKVGDMVFKDIPSAVVDWSQNYALTCRNIDGILGANQMKDAIWKFNYNEEKVEVTKNLSNFDITEFEYIIPFEHQMQKTPLVEMKMFDETITLLFDTGSNGEININKIPDGLDSLSKEKKIEVLGVNTFGMYGTGAVKKSYLFEVNNVAIGNLPLQDPAINTGSTSTIGNKILEHYTFIVDWNEKQIYLKKISDIKHTHRHFGFGYRFIDNKAIVSYVYQTGDSQLKNGDTIVSINERYFENLNDEQVCEFSKDKIESNIDSMDIQIKRNDQVLEFHLKKNTYFK